MPRVAHFLQNPNLLGSPPNEALVAAYRSLGFEVDLFSTWPSGQAPCTEPGVRLMPAHYSWRWLLKNIARPSWGAYSLFSATTEEPLAAAGLLARLWRKPLVTIADEIRNGSYAGNRGARWKALCQWGMRQSAVTVVNEQERVEIQRVYAGLPADAEVLVYPGCLRSPPAPGDRDSLRAGRGIPADALVLCYSGMMSHDNGGLWMAEALRAQPALWVWGQIVNLDPLARGLLQRIEGNERLVLEQTRMGWQEAWASMAAADIGMVVYLQDAPQYRHMGIASNRLCMFLAMGVPVVASRQPSFEFIERYDCGVLIDTQEQMGPAIERIASRLPSMRANALNYARDYIRAPERYETLKTAVGAQLRVTQAGKGVVHDRD